MEINATFHQVSPALQWKIKLFEKVKYKSSVTQITMSTDFKNKFNTIHFISNIFFIEKMKGVANVSEIITK